MLIPRGQPGKGAGGVGEWALLELTDALPYSIYTSKDKSDKTTNMGYCVSSEKRKVDFL